MQTNPDATFDSRPARGLALLLLIEALFNFAPIAVLGPAIGWPASLTNPAAQQLAAIAAHPDAVAFGYGLYLLFSIALAPLMIAFAARTFGSLQGPVAMTVAVFAGLSTLARSLGILRWLTVMPILAQQSLSADAATHAQLEMLFTAIHSYAGGIGEILGVGLFMAIAMGTLSIGGALSRRMPGWLVGLGLLAAATELALALPAIGIPLHISPAPASVSLSLWLVGAAVFCFKARNKAA
ncbi:MAG: DUF4386 family protein [Pseudomonadota bacterium]